MDKENVIGHLEILRTWCAVNPKYGMTLSVEDCDKAVGWLDDAIALLKAQNKDLEIVRNVREGRILKHGGDGVIIINLGWWKKMVERDGFKVVPSVEDLQEVQEPRVMTLEEVRALQDGAVVWIEDNDKVDIIPAIVNHVWNSLPNIVSFAMKNMREVKADMLWYGVKWRCWTSRPTDEQREATPWERK